MLPTSCQAGQPRKRDVWCTAWPVARFPYFTLCQILYLFKTYVQKHCPLSFCLSVFRTKCPFFFVFFPLLTFCNSSYATLCNSIYCVHSLHGFDHHNIVNVLILHPEYLPNTLPILTDHSKNYYFPHSFLPYCLKFRHITTSPFLLTFAFPSSFHRSYRMYTVYIFIMSSWPWISIF